MSLLVVGSMAYDGIETPFGKRDRILGGSATYISLTSSYFVDDVNLVGVVGRDFAKEDIELFRGKGVSLDGLQIDETGDTFFYRGKYSFDLNNRESLETSLNVFETFDPVIPELYQKSRYIALGNIKPDLQQRVLDQVESPDFVVMDTMNFWIEGMPAELRTIIGNVDMLVLNDSEARELTGESNLFKAADVIMGMGPKHLVIKKGEHGALLFTGGEIFSAPALPLVDIFDPTGAGDSFLGGFLGWLAYTRNHSTVNMRRAVIFGSVMASFCVEQFGPDRLRNLTNDEIYARYLKFQQLSQIPEIEE